MFEVSFCSLYKIINPKGLQHLQLELPTAVLRSYFEMPVKAHAPGPHD